MLTHTPKLRSLVATTVVAGIVAAACGGGGSVNDAGLDDEPNQVPVTDAAGATDADSTDGGDDVEPVDSASVDPDTTDSDATDGDTGDADDDVTPDGSAEGDAPPVSEAPAPTTTAVPVVDLPPCPVGALDSAGGPVELTLWFGLAGDLPEVLQSLADEYNASQDRVSVTIQNQTDYESVIDKFVEFDVEDRPELVLAPEFITQTFAQSELFVPVASCIAETGFDTSTFLPAALNAYGFSGVQWGLPFNASTPVLYYNRKMFEAAGLDPDDPPLTFEEVRVVSRQLVDSGAAAHGLVVDNARDSGSGGAAFEQWFGRLGEPFADNGNGRLAPATEVSFDTESGTEMLTYLQDMVREGLAVSVGENAGGQAGLLKLADEDAPAAMVIETSAALGTVIAALGSGLVPGLTPDDVGVAFMPGPTDEPGAQVGGGSLWIPAGKGDVAVAAAWDFIEFLSTAETQSTWADATGYLPVRSDAVDLDPVATTYEQDPRWRVAYDQVVAVPDDPLSTRPVLGPQREVRQQIADAIARVYADVDGADPAAELAEAATASDRLIQNYNDLN